MRRLSRVVLVALGLLSAGAAPVACAQAYPSKPIRLILPFPPGGPTDIVGRIVGASLSEVVGQSVVADSRPGAAGNIGLELASKSPPDGYTIVLSSPIIALSSLLYSKLNYDPHKDLAPIALVGAVHNVFVVHPSVPARTLKEFIALARSRPGKLNYGSGGVGTTTHLAPELLKSMMKIDMVHVPYKGSGLAAVALASGQVDALVVAAPAAQSLIQAGRIRPLAVLAASRLPVLPNVPTAKEAGVDNFEILVWYGILAPAGTPRDIISRLNAALKKVVSAPETKEKMATAGVEPMSSTPEEYAAFIRSEAERFAKVIRDAGIRGD